jgi:ligand-binding sensor domain-containing protein
MRIAWMKRWRVVLPIVLLLGAASAAGILYWHVSRALRGSEASLEAEQNLKFTGRPFTPVANPGFEWVSSPAVFTRAAEFEGRLYVAGPAALLEYDDRGNLTRQFRVGIELPSAVLVDLARGALADTHQPELLIATADLGILAFNGSSFRQILAEDRDARSITAILPLSSGHLLIGTAKRGLLVYDGRRLGPFHPTLAHIHVTELAGTGSDLWIGTQDRGVAHWHGGAAEWFAESSGLPDSRVFSIALAGDRAYIGTSTGIAEFDAGRFVRVLAQGAFVRALLVRGNDLLAATMDSGVLRIPLTHSSRNLRQFDAFPDLADVEQFLDSSGSLYAVTTSGIHAQAAGGRWKRVLQPTSGLLTDRNISALAVEPSGRLWVGYFDRGLDIVSADGRTARHMEDDHIFCVNRIVPNAMRGATAVATANGLVLFDSHGTRQQVLGRLQGLIADHVTDLAPYRDGMAIATPAGLTFLDSGGMRSLYAFHGLVNNHVYSLGVSGNQLLAGTLGGASLLEDDQVRASYTTATSALRHNWITAVIPGDGEWWIGTYGSGVMRMDTTGHFERPDTSGVDVVINPNAMFATKRFILAGTMGRGLYMVDRVSHRSLFIADGLPSLNVTALAAATDYVYVGTDNGLVRIPETRLGQ